MVQDWTLRYAASMRDYEEYSIGKLLGLINDPEIISLAGGLPSQEVFLQTEYREATRQRLDRDIARIMPYSAIRGEAELTDAIVTFLERDGIHAVPEKGDVHGKQYCLSSWKGLDNIASGTEVAGGIWGGSWVEADGGRIPA